MKKNKKWFDNKENKYRKRKNSKDWREELEEKPKKKKFSLKRFFYSIRFKLGL